MDPKACLIEAQDRLRDKDYAELTQRLHDYFQWRLSGGFCPMFEQNVSGDVLALDLMIKLADKV